MNTTGQAKESSDDDDEDDDDDDDEEEATGKVKDSISKSIFVGHINFKTKDTELAEFFSKCGEIKKAHVVPRKGFGFVDFATVEAVDEALKLDKTKFNGRDIHIERSKSGPKDKKKNNAKKAAEKGQKKPVPGQFVKMGGAPKRNAAEDSDDDSDEDGAPPKKMAKQQHNKKFNPKFQNKNNKKGNFQGQKGKFKPGNKGGKFQGKKNKAK